MRAAAQAEDVASDRRRRKNLPCNIGSMWADKKKIREDRKWKNRSNKSKQFGITGISGANGFALAVDEELKLEEAKEWERQFRESIQKPECQGAG